MSTALLSWFGFFGGAIGMTVYFLLVLYRPNLKFLNMFMLGALWLFASIITMAGSLLIDTPGSITDWTNQHLSDLFWGAIIIAGLYGLGVIWAWPESNR